MTAVLVVSVYLLTLAGGIMAVVRWSGWVVTRTRQRFVEAARLGAVHVCPFCGGVVDVRGNPRSWQIDHAVPRHHGGGHDPGNLRPAHTACNARAGQAMSTRSAVRPW